MSRKKITAVLTMEEYLHEVNKYKDTIIVLEDALTARDKLHESQRTKVWPLKEEKYSLLSKVVDLWYELEDEKVNELLVDQKEFKLKLKYK